MNAVLSAAAEQRLAPLLSVLPLHLPHQKGAELGPEVVVLHLVVAEEQIVGVQHGHQPGELKGYQFARRRAP